MSTSNEKEKKTGRKDLSMKSSQSVTKDQENWIIGVSQKLRSCKVSRREETDVFILSLKYSVSQQFTPTVYQSRIIYGQLTYVCKLF